MSTPPEHPLNQLLLLDRIATSLERLVKIECLKSHASIADMEALYDDLTTAAPLAEEDFQTEADTIAARMRFRDALERGYPLSGDEDLESDPWSERLRDDRRGANG